MTISAAAASTLSWSQAITAGSVVAGSLFSSQPILLVQDVYGNGVPSAVVALSLFTESTCVAAAGAIGLSGNTATSASDGLATFTSFNATKAGMYYVKASASVISSTCSTAALTVTFGPVFSLSFVTQPGGSINAGSSFTKQPIVFVSDQFRNAVPFTSVTLSAYIDNQCVTPGSGSVSNGILSSASTGNTTFSLVSYDRSETIFLKATVSGKFMK